jgi:hypothetical protein
MVLLLQRTFTEVATGIKYAGGTRGLLTAFVISSGGLQLDNAPVCTQAIFSKQ